MSKARTGPPEHDTPPRYLPDVPPPQHGADYGLHTLTAVIEMQKSLGVLTAKVERLVEDVKTQGDKIDGMRLKLALFAGGGAVVGALIGGLVAVLNAIPWDRLFPPT